MLNLVIDFTIIIFIIIISKTNSIFFVIDFRRSLFTLIVF